MKIFYPTGSSYVEPRYNPTDSIDGAMVAYFRKHGNCADEPAIISGVRTHQGIDYVVLENVNGILAVYRIIPPKSLGGPRLRQVKSWPKEIETGEYTTDPKDIPQIRKHTVVFSKAYLEKVVQSYCLHDGDDQAWVFTQDRSANGYRSPTVVLRSSKQGLRFDVEPANGIHLSLGDIRRILLDRERSNRRNDEWDMVEITHTVVDTMDASFMKGEPTTG